MLCLNDAFFGYHGVYRFAVLHFEQLLKVNAGYSHGRRYLLHGYFGQKVFVDIDHCRVDVYYARFFVALGRNTVRYVYKQIGG